MIKLKYGACLWLLLLNLNTHGVVGENSKEETDLPTRRIMKVQMEALPSFFHSGTLTIGPKRLPISSSSLEQDYIQPFLTVVGTRSSFSLYNGRYEEGWSLPQEEVIYVLRSIVEGHDVSGSLSDPFKEIFKCPENVPLCAHVTFSSLYTKELNSSELGNLFLTTPPLTLEFKEMIPS